MLSIEIGLKGLVGKIRPGTNVERNFFTAITCVISWLGPTELMRYDEDSRTHETKILD